MNTAGAAPRSDEELMLNFKAGDAAAFETLYMKHRAGVFNFIYQFLRENAETSEEHLQEVFLKVIQSAPRYRPKAKFTTWLYQIARNHCIDMARKRRFRRTTSLDRPGDGQDESLLERRFGDSSPSPERRAYLLEVRASIASAVEGLPNEQREVFLMREVSGIPFQEIADIVGCPLNTVKSRMRYALERIQKHLSDAGIGGNEVMEHAMS